MAEATLVEWLMTQAPLTVVLVYFVRWLQVKNQEAETEIKRLNAENTNLAKDVIKMTVSWEQKHIRDNEINAELKRLLVEKNDANSELKRLLVEVKNTIKKQ